MQLLRFLVLVFINTVAASNCSVFDNGNFQASCYSEGFEFGPHFLIGAICLRADSKSNRTTKLSLSKCIGYNVKESKLVWKVPSCNTTTADEQGWNSTQGQENLSVLPSRSQ
ncbi:hypothetical protein B0H65DRAFT_425561 [Neurospora tetraspora]|uniref:Cyanovirin-N domain-containing protein n=1 Tax=Neurospora tetraspora TaxID=94610 RepID=A0AAE0JFW4_9PEZI|nr:hypothetical protein B0H65DRAFT_425561 [Neurospora tetraspora]